MLKEIFFSKGDTVPVAACVCVIIRRRISYKDDGRIYHVDL